MYAVSALYLSVSSSPTKEITYPDPDDGNETSGKNFSPSRSDEYISPLIGCGSGTTK